MMDERDFTWLEQHGAQVEITFSQHYQERIVERVRDLLKAQNLSQRDFATAIAMPEGMLSKILTGTRKLHSEELIRMARVLNQPVGDFLDPPGTE